MRKPTTSIRVDYETRDKLKTIAGDLSLSALLRRIAEKPEANLVQYHKSDTDLSVMNTELTEYEGIFSGKSLMEVLELIYNRTGAIDRSLDGARGRIDDTWRMMKLAVSQGQWDERTADQARLTDMENKVNNTIDDTERDRLMREFHKELKAFDEKYQ